MEDASESPPERIERKTEELLPVCCLCVVVAFQDCVFAPAGSVVWPCSGWEERGHGGAQETSRSDQVRPPPVHVEPRRGPQTHSVLVGI